MTSEQMGHPGGVYGWCVAAAHQLCSTQLALGSRLDTALARPGRSALSAAAHGDHAPAVKLLLTYGANPDVKDGDGDAYPVHWVQSPEVASLLVEAGANLTVRNRLGERAEETSKRMNRPEVEEVYRDGRAVPRMGWVPVAKPKKEHAPPVAAREE